MGKKLTNWAFGTMQQWVVMFVYFDAMTFALIGYRFYHDESKNDGEYILLSGETTINGMRLPKVRKWYTHQADKFLGTDTLVSGQ